MLEQGRCIIHRFKLSNIIAFWIIVFVSGCFGGAGAMTLHDQKGRTIEFSRPFTRIISLYGAHTENLYYLGLEDHIVGVSINDRFPPRVNKKPGLSYHDDPEKFLALNPDLVLIRPMIDHGYPKLIQRLERSGIAVVSLQPRGIDDMYEYWLKLGLLTGKTARAEQMVDDFKKKTARIKALTNHLKSKKKVYFQSIHKRMKTFTPGSIQIFALETAGGINVAADAKASRNTNIANYGKEHILAKASLIDVFLAQKGRMNPVTVRQIRTEPGFGVIKAVKDNKVFFIDEDIVSRPVPRLYKGIVFIGKLLYPDIFTHENLNKDE
jgi:iron complex transport system substrate-binding protein